MSNESNATATSRDHDHHQARAHAEVVDTGSHHVTPPFIYWRVYWLLLFFMAVTIVAAFVHLGPFNNFVAMAIAVIKAALVVLFFMQVRYSSRLTWMWAAAGFVWLLLLFLIVGDYITRDWGKAIGW